MDKKITRKKYIQLRDQMDFKEASRLSYKVFERLYQSDLFQNSGDIFTYVSTKNEVDTRELIEVALKENKKVAVPKTYGNGLMRFCFIKSLDELKLSKFGILEPVEVENEALPNKTSLMLVPGVAFDKDKNRMGYGAGYYDRYLKEHTYYKSIGLAYTNQILEDMEVEAWDISMDVVLTDTTIYGNL